MKPMYIKCKKCGGSHISFQLQSENKKRGCFAVFMWIILAICTCGLVLLIPLLTKKGSKEVTYAVCQDCGYKWRV